MTPGFRGLCCGIRGFCVFGEQKDGTVLTEKTRKARTGAVGVVGLIKKVAHYADGQ
jgi:hypothetical protein